MSVAVLASYAVLAVAAGRSQPETFVIRANPTGPEATIEIPVGAIASFSATRAEALDNYAGPEVEAMRLEGDVHIAVLGSAAPIEIKADQVVLELTADDVRARQSPVGMPRSQSRRVIDGGGDFQSFVGDVVFTVQTSAGAMRITADRVDHAEGLTDRVRRHEGV